MRQLATRLSDIWTFQMMGNAVPQLLVFSDSPKFPSRHTDQPPPLEKNRYHKAVTLCSKPTTLQCRNLTGLLWICCCSSSWSQQVVSIWFMSLLSIFSRGSAVVRLHGHSKAYKQVHVLGHSKAFCITLLLLLFCSFFLLKSHTNTSIILTSQR